MFLLRGPLTADDAVHLPHQAAGLEQELLGVCVRVRVLHLALLGGAATPLPLAQCGEGGCGELTAEVALDVVQLAQVPPKQRHHRPRR